MSGDSATRARGPILVELRDARAAADRKTGWFGALDNFLKSAVGGAALTVLVTTLVGGGFGAWITYHFASIQQRIARDDDRQKLIAAQRQERLTASQASRKDLIETTAKILTARRVYAGLVRSAIENRAPKKDVDARWADYQRAYVDFNYELFAFRAATLSYLGANIAKPFIHVLETDISGSFGRVDACLTAAYFRYRTNPSRAAAMLSGCPARADKQAWSVHDETDAQLRCIASFEIEFADSIYIENNFDLLPADRQARPTAGLPPLAVCVSGGDWACIRRYNRDVVGAKLAQGCSALDDAHYIAAKHDVAPPAGG